MTLLTKKQCFGDNRLYIFNICKTACAITDFAILLGGAVSWDYYTAKGLATWWWTKTPYDGTGAYGVSYDTTSSWTEVFRRVAGVRPVLPYSSNFGISSNGDINEIIKEVEYGEYPQTIVAENFAIILERAYQNGAINQTGKMYTTDSVKYNDYNTPFQARTHIEYEYNGKKIYSICR